LPFWGNNPVRTAVQFCPVPFSGLQGFDGLEGNWLDANNIVRFERIAVAAWATNP